MIKRVITLSIFLFAVCLCHSAFAEQPEAFVPGFEDIPLMPGLIETNEAITSFDSPSGRFIQVYMVADKDLSITKIRNFYKESLIPLGWKQAQKTSCFDREDELLCIYVSGAEKNLIVRFELNTVTK